MIPSTSLTSLFLWLVANSRTKFDTISFALSYNSPEHLGLSEVSTCLENIAVFLSASPSKHDSFRIQFHLFQRDTTSERTRRTTSPFVLKTDTFWTFRSARTCTICTPAKNEAGFDVSSARNNFFMLCSINIGVQTCLHKRNQECGARCTSNSDFCVRELERRSSLVALLQLRICAINGCFAEK